MRVDFKTCFLTINSNLLSVMILLLTFLSVNSFSQSNIKYINEKSIGAFTSTGFPLYDLEEDVQYHPSIIGGVLHLPLYQTKSNFNIAIEVMPQVGFVAYNNSMEYELGLNVIFAFGYQVSENSIISINIGSGPHYITATINRQATGFIFSDHLNIGFRQRFNSWQAGLSAGIRHISNAGLEEPNLGIENIGVGLSVAKLF